MILLIFYLVACESFPVKVHYLVESVQEEDREGYQECKARCGQKSNNDLEGVREEQ